jgi:hypothetical protein
MKKILLSLLFFINYTLYAQNNPYQCFTRTVDYVDLVNPVPVNAGAVWNAETTYPIDFDFNFVIYDQTFSYFVVEAGGGISFPNSGYKAIRVYHTPFGGYYLQDKGVGSSVSSIGYEVSGEDLHKIIKVQWKNAGFIQWYANSDPTDYVDFQIWIFQEDAHIELHFGPNQTDAGTYGYPDGTSDPDPGPSIKFYYDSCSNVLSYYLAADNPAHDYFDMCEPNYSFIDGTPSENTTYIIQPSPVPLFPGGITFGDQAAIDSFQTNYPTCSEIQGSVVISGDDITDLQGLSYLIRIHGDLDIGTLNQGNPDLADLSGLDNLMEIGGSLSITHNDALGSLGSLTVSSIGKGLVITQNASLPDLHGLENVTQLDSSLVISENNLLISLHGLNNLISTGEGIELSSNNNLNDLSDLQNLTSAGGKLWMSGNDLLTGLNGLGNIDVNSISDLKIYNNPSLSVCDVQSICEYLSSPAGTFEIHDNYTGCQSRSEISRACMVGIAGTPFQNDFSIFPNPAKTEISFLNSENIQECTILDQLCQKILHQSCPVQIMDVSMLKPGIYIVEIITTGTTVRKILVITD